MDHQEPGLWSSLMDLSGRAMPVVSAAALAVVLSFLRHIYDGGNTLKRMTVESAMCGLIAVVLVSGLDLFGLPQSASTFVGGMVGFLGVEKIRQLAERWLGRRVR